MALATQPKPADFSPTPPSGEARSYWSESRQPIYSALLVLPFLMIYEVGLVVLRSDVINGGQAILKHLGAPVVQFLGVSGGLISIVFIVAAFFVWQFRRKGTWKVQWPVLSFMFFESLFYAVLLFLVLRAFVHYVAEDPRPPVMKRHTMMVERVPSEVVCAARSTGESGTDLRDFVLYCGAGVYEELVFRVILLGLLMLVLTKFMHMEHAYAAAWAVFLGAVIFAAYHHVGATGDKFEVNVFLQRLLCGLYFSTLYYTRSFGVAAASHALYDIVVGLNRMGA
ncbi:MAG: CPBP family intramembrane glutamic endopeptidase [Planctomycetota bacterium]